MEKLTNSMVEISKASEETLKIIKTIDEIAFQTNLLALNAAVEKHVREKQALVLRWSLMKSATSQ